MDRRSNKWMNEWLMDDQIDGWMNNINNNNNNLIINK